MSDLFRLKASYLSSWTSRCLLLCAMHNAGVRRLTGCNAVLLKDFAAAFPDQKSWFKRLCRSRCWDTEVLSDTFRSLAYKGRPEFFSMYGCVYGCVQESQSWLHTHRRDLQKAMATFAHEHGFDCAPAATVKHVSDAA